jgi:mitogen-activated protein kinase-activated protein kinase 2
MYILCCGYPPFYSTHGQRISPGMEKRIKLGKYDFPETEWHLISNEAKSLIDGMLETVPERRLTIEEIMKNQWILVFKVFLIFSFFLFVFFYSKYY